MKRLIPLFIIISALWACSKESDTDNSGSNNNINNSSDTLEFSKIEVKQEQQSLVMLGTATWCQYCGQWGDPSLYALMSGKTNEWVKTVVDTTKVNAIELHPSNSPVDPLYNLVSTKFHDSLEINSIPDVWADGHNYWTQPGSWSKSVLDKQANKNVICAIGMSKVLKGDTFTVYVKLKQYKTDSNYRLAVYAVEDNVVARQATPTGYVTKYVHRNVLRAELSGVSYLGTWLIKGKSLKEYKAKYTYIVPSGQNVNNIKFVASANKMYKYSSGDWTLWYPVNSCTTR